MSKVTVEDRGRILIPKDIREKTGLKGGEELRAEEIDGEIVLTPISNKESLKQLKGCIEDSEVSASGIKNIWDE